MIIILLNKIDLIIIYSIVIKLEIMSNFIQSEEENIRPPDEAIREILIDYGSNYDINFGFDYTNYDNIEIIPNEDEYENELQMAIIESTKEQEAYEKNLSEKTNLRVQTFKDVLLKIKKISMFDKTFLKFCNIIEPIIDSYCACYIDVYECDKIMYDLIFGTLKTIRITEVELMLFENLFVMEN